MEAHIFNGGSLVKLTDLNTITKFHLKTLPNPQTNKQKQQQESASKTKVNSSSLKYYTAKEMPWIDQDVY